MMYAETDRILARQNADIRRHVRRILVNLIAQERAKRPGLGPGLGKVPFAGARLQDLHHPGILSALPAAVYVTDAAGYLTFYNEAAVALWGRRPMLGKDRWCGSWRIYRPDGTPLPHGECPMAVALREDREVRNVDAVAERPDGSRVHFMPFATPLHDEANMLVGAVNVMIEIDSLRVPPPALAVLRGT